MLFRSHDNSDDGFSDHERCESSVTGGLFEYNGGAGIAPALGSHCVCRDVYARHNGDAGYYCTGNPLETESGVGTQIVCFNCVSENNDMSGGTKYGFRTNGSAVSGFFYQCLAINEGYGYYTNNTSDMVQAVDCEALNCTTPAHTNVSVINGMRLS